MLPRLMALVLVLDKHMFVVLLSASLGKSGYATSTVPQQCIAAIAKSLF
jgi:hypothetical protein